MFPHALIAGLLIGPVCALLGVFVILKRMVFIGITLSEVAACGIAAGMICHVHPFAAAAALTLVAVFVLSYPFELNRLPRDAVLGIVFVLSSSVSVLLVAKSGFGLQEVKALLYGDLILTSPADLTIILATMLPVLAWLAASIRPTLYTFLDREGARILGIRVALWEMLFFVALGLGVAAASKVAGALLVFCYLVAVPASALLLSRRLWLVIATATVFATVSTVLGLCLAIRLDLPTNQTVATVTCGCVFLASGFALGRSLIGRVSLR
jgi:ABC-type Mn2+/Zn2+ transport system permease subunit